MRIVVDRGRCSGMGICESIAPEHFEVGDDGVMRLLREEGDTLDARSAVGSCPAGSLRLVEDPAVGPAPVTSLAWGVKASFVGYVRAVGGSIVADEGAHEEGGAFVFPASGTETSDASATAAGRGWRFEGRVTFRAHDGLLDVRIGDPWVRLVDDGLELSVTDERGEWVVVATGRSDGPVGTPVPVDLVPGAEHLFASTYPAGTPLAPLVLHPPTARTPSTPPAQPPA